MNSFRSYAVGLFRVDLSTLPHIMTSQFRRLSACTAQKQMLNGSQKVRTHFCNRVTPILSLLLPTAKVLNHN
jgi:hypothetical protein